MMSNPHNRNLQGDVMNLGSRDDNINNEGDRNGAGTRRDNKISMYYSGKMNTVGGGGVISQDYTDSWKPN